MFAKIISFIKKETVLSVAWALAFSSTIFVHPSKEYFSYIDFNTLILLFCLMTVMAAFMKLGAFESCSKQLLKRFNSLGGILFILIFMPFFFSMIITNDVALIVFVPLAIITLKMCCLENLILWTVVLQTLAANLGSMTLPMGNPQNLYLYSISGISIKKFIYIMIPYTIASFLGLLLCVIFIQHKFKCKIEFNNLDEKNTNKEKTTYSSTKKMWCINVLTFTLCLLCVGKLISTTILFPIILILYFITDRKILKQIDYSLLLTFIGFFIFTGNIKNMETAKNLIESMIVGHETIFSILVSQVISNVPAALLLSCFTKNYAALLIGTNLGGLGTLIASMASLISFKQIAKNYHKKRARYFLLFTIMNLIFLALLFSLFLIL